MPLDPRIQAFMEQAGLLVQAGSLPREPMVLLAEQRAAIEKAKPLLSKLEGRELVNRASLKTCLACFGIKMK